MIPDIWRIGEIAVIGLGKSGTAVSTLLAREGARVYASDAGTSASIDSSVALLRPLGVDVDAGRHDLDRIARATLVVASPGVPPKAPPLDWVGAEFGGRFPLERDAALFWRMGRSAIVPVTFGETLNALAIAGMVLGMRTVVTPEMGWNMLLPAFAAAVLGGVGSPVGAVVASIVLGIAQELSTPFLGFTYKIGFAFAVLVAILAIRPAGLFGRLERVR